MIVLYLVCGYYVIGLVSCWVLMEYISKEDPQFLWDYHKYFSAYWNMNTTKALLVLLTATVWIVLVPSLIVDLLSELDDKG